MNIPLDRLYHYIENIAEEIHGDCVIIYRFWPHGSKNIDDLNILHELKSDWYERNIYPSIWCNDQEPLDYEFYKTNTRQLTSKYIDCLKTNNTYLPPDNLKYFKGMFEKGLLLHSEKRSSNVIKYQQSNEFIPIYYWSHAVLARDWFRFAEHVKQTKNVKKIFLIYNRAWSGTREYRLRFTEMLVTMELINQCKTSVSFIEPGLNLHYNFHTFKNPKWKPTIVLENFFPINTAPSHYSADFDIEDYKTTDIEVVLETLFDDNRLHLTEKSLRPIACGQPFILAGTHLSLEYLQSYGFKTFAHIWDETYDQEINSLHRLNSITTLMQQIANWPLDVRQHKMAEARAIAEYNRQHFFSKEFFNLIIGELKTNLILAFDDLRQCDNYTAWSNRWSQLLSIPDILNFINNNHDESLPTKKYIDLMIDLAKRKLNK